LGSQSGPAVVHVKHSSDILRQCSTTKCSRSRLISGQNFDQIPSLLQTECLRDTDNVKNNEISHDTTRAPISHVRNIKTTTTLHRILTR